MKSRVKGRFFDPYFLKGKGLSREMKCKVFKDGTIRLTGVKVEEETFGRSFVAVYCQAPGWNRRLIGRLWLRLC